MVKNWKGLHTFGGTNTTGLGDGSRRCKDDPQRRVVGSVDEANVAVGFAPLSPWPAASVGRVQNCLLKLDKDLAMPIGIIDSRKFVLARGHQPKTQIATANENLLPLTSFILPTGTLAITALHLAHTITRLAKQDGVTPIFVRKVSNRGAKRYLNRLSSYPFVLSRVEKAASGNVFSAVWCISPLPAALRGYLNVNVDPH